MTEEQKIKRAKELYGNLVYPKTHIELYVDGYLAGAKELEQKLEQTEKDLADYQFNYPSIKELETENNKLLDVINNQDVKIVDLEKQIEKMKNCNNCADYYTEQEQSMDRVSRGSETTKTVRLHVKKFREDYKLSGKTFNVIVTHWHTDGYADVGIAPEEHWCLYVVIGNTHPLFKKACDKGEDEYGFDHGDKIYPNWHGGCTYYNEQDTYVKIGCDYQHIGDEQYWSCTEMPKDIEDDAGDLFKFFEDAEQIKEIKENGI